MLFPTTAALMDEVLPADVPVVVLPAVDGEAPRFSVGAPPRTPEHVLVVTNRLFTRSDKRAPD